MRPRLARRLRRVRRRRWSTRACECVAAGIAVARAGARGRRDRRSAAAPAWTSPRRSRSAPSTTSTSATLDYRAEHLAPGLPVLAIPTTAGTASETNGFGVFADRETGRKIYLGNATVQPFAALLDPELTVGLPAPATAAAGMDALSHALESLCARNGNPYSEALAHGVARTVARVPAARRRRRQRPRGARRAAVRVAPGGPRAADDRARARARHRARALVAHRSAARAGLRGRAAAGAGGQPGRARGAPGRRLAPALGADGADGASRGRPALSRHGRDGRAAGRSRPDAGRSRRWWRATRWTTS